MRPTSVPSGILIQSFGDNGHGLKMGGGFFPLREGELGSHLTQCGQCRGLYLHVKFRLDSSNRLATVHQRRRQDRTDNGLIAQGEPFYKRSPRNSSTDRNAVWDAALGGSKELCITVRCRQCRCPEGNWHFGGDWPIGKHCKALDFGLVLVKGKALYKTVDRS